MALLPAMIKLMPVPQVLKALEPRKRYRSSSLTVSELAHLVNAVSRRGPRFGVGACFIRSLMLYNVLRRFAYDPVLLIGGKLNEGDLECHCWIEVDGEPLCEFNSPRRKFEVFYAHEERRI